MKSASVRTSTLSLAALAAIFVFVSSSRSMAQGNAYGPPRNDPSQYDSNRQQDMQDDQRADPPARVGRLSVMQGNVSYQPANVQDFSAAELNYPLTSGDRLYTDAGARAEMEAGQLAVRLGQQTDFTVTALSDDYVQFGLAQGSIHVRAYALDENNGSEIDTPNASVTLLQPGDTRIDVFPQDNVTVVCVFSGQVRVDAEGVQQVLQTGQCLTVRGLNPARAEMNRRPRADDLDRFSGQRDALYQQAFSAEGGYVGADTIGAGDLASYGDWSNDNDYGAVWYPRGLEADWAPYSNGHWVSIAPWGWTWVGAEPWGFCPFHYGRWARFGPRWGWIPGPRVVHPVYSPALVVFVGGSGVSFGGGRGVAAWFPLGPREVYRPWYRSSTVYVNRVNVTNIYNRNTVEVRSVYNDRRDVYAGREGGRGRDGQISYVNRSLATVAIPQRNFGSGRPVRESAIRLNTPDAQRQFQNAPVMNRPPVAAPVQQMAGALPPRALPARVQRPVLEQRGVVNGNGGRSRRDGFNGDGGARTNGSGVSPGNRDAQFNQRNPGVPVPVTPGQTVPAVQPGRDNASQSGFGGRNDGRGNNDGRFNGSRGTAAPLSPAQPAAPATVTQPAAPVQPGQSNRNGGYPGNYGNGTSNNGNRGDGRLNDGRFNNGRNPAQPSPAAPATQTTQPAVPSQTVQPAIPVRQYDGARQYPQRQGETSTQEQRSTPPPARVIVEHPAAVQQSQQAPVPRQDFERQRQNDQQQQRQNFELQRQQQVQQQQVQQQQQQQRQNSELQRQQQVQQQQVQQQQQQRQNYEQQQRQNFEQQHQQRQAAPAPQPQMQVQPQPQRQNFEQPRPQPAPQRETSHTQQAAPPTAAEKK